MSRYVFKMPDLGEGTVSAEVLKWYVAPGDVVVEDQVIAEVMTEKAAIEVPAPVSGRVLSIHGQPGDMVAVGAELIVFDTGGGESASVPPAPAAAAKDAPLLAGAPAKVNGPGAREAAPGAAAAERTGRVMASPATRRRAKAAGLDLGAIAGTGPGGRITRADLDAALSAGQAPGAVARDVGGAHAPVARDGVTEIKVMGLRRVIATRMAEAKRTIPHFAYVEEVDVTELESLREHLNSRKRKDQPSLTYLPFIALALARVLEDFPQCNATYDAERNVILQHAAVHLGIATQTPDGLKVPVVRNVESLTLWQVAEAIRAASERARTNRSTREELSGSTITLTSLGKLGGIVSTPVINAPEVGIVGVNKAVDRPAVLNGAITVRRMMNLSSSFDHRFVDGFDAAAMIQALKSRLEHPATIFMQN